MQQAAPDDNTHTFLAWRVRHGLSLADAVKALGMTPHTMSAYTEFSEFTVRSHINTLLKTIY
jgi:hypothetical protein